MKKAFVLGDLFAILYFLGGIYKKCTLDFQSARMGWKNPIIAQACQTDLGPYSISTRVRESSLTKHQAKIQLNSEKNLVVYRGLCYPVMYGKRVLYGFVLWLLCLWVIKDHYTYQWIMYDRVGWFDVFGWLVWCFLGDGFDNRFHLDEWWAYIGLHWLIILPFPYKELIPKKCTIINSQYIVHESMFIQFVDSSIYMSVPKVPRKKNVARIFSSQETLPTGSSSSNLQASFAAQDVELGTEAFRVTCWTVESWNWDSMNSGWFLLGFIYIHINLKKCVYIYILLLLLIIIYHCYHYYLIYQQSVTWKYDIFYPPSLWTITAWAGHTCTGEFLPVSLNCSLICWGMKGFAKQSISSIHLDHNILITKTWSWDWPCYQSRFYNSKEKHI